MSENDLIELTEMLALKKELMSSVLSSLKRSTGLLEEDNVDDFNSEMDRCEAIMRRIDEIGEKEISMYAPGDKKPASITEAESEIRYIAGQVSDANMECNNAAKEKLLIFGHRLKSLRQKRQGVACYAYRGSAIAAFVDMKL